MGAAGPVPSPPAAPPAPLPPARRAALVLAVAVATLALDRVTKLAAEAALAGRGRLSWLGDTVRLELVHNSGAFLGLGAGLSPTARSALFVAGVAVISLGALWAALRAGGLTPWQVAALALLGGGGLGNLWDRVAAGAVTDFANLGVGWLRTGVFNVADVAIMAGVVLLAWPRRGVSESPPVD
jgi:signal peptidase II